MEPYREFLRDHLKHYVAQLTRAMQNRNRTGAHFGYSPVGDTLTRLINWLRSDDETASLEAGFDLEITARNLYNEFEVECVLPEKMEALNEYIRQRNEVNGLDTPEKRLQALGERMKAAKLAERERLTLGQAS